MQRNALFFVQSFTGKVVDANMKNEIINIKLLAV